jgi:hypothetical protein
LLEKLFLASGDWENLQSSAKSEKMGKIVAKS